MTAYQAIPYQKRFAQFMADMERISKLQPAEEYLYPILDTPVFSDMQTALMMAELNFKESQRTK